MPAELKIPPVGESITEVQIGEWRKAEGDAVVQDESVVELETEKATFDIPAPVAGVMDKILKKNGETARVGEVIGYIKEGSATGAEKLQERGKEKPRAASGTGATSERKGAAKPQAAGRADEKEKPAGDGEPRVMPAARRALAEKSLHAEEVPPSGPGGRLLKEDVARFVEQPREPQPSSAAAPSTPERTATSRGEEEIVPMSLIRRRIAQRLVEAQQTAALLTTFNEVDMSAVISLRQKYRDTFQEKNGVKLGFMSFFVKGVVEALKQVPQLNAEIRGTDIVYRNYYDIGIAVGGGKGLVVPVLRNAERLSFAEIETAIEDFGKRARDNKLTVDELRGGTFTISNGGIYGSLLSTPIVNPPQSGILGMHAIQDRPVAREGQVVIRPMMYVALTYDHRLVDGREAVTFLVRLKELLEEPARILLEV